MEQNTVALTKLPVSIVTCPVCRDIPLNRKIFQCQFGHIICEACNNELAILSFSQCPTCRVSMSGPIRNRIIEETLHFIEVACPYSRLGCLARLPRTEVIPHSKECLYRPIQLCKILGFANCNFDVSSSTDDVTDHLTRVHGIARETGDFLSLDISCVSNSYENGGFEVVKIFGSKVLSRHRTTIDSTYSHHNHSSASFLFLLKQDGSGGMLALCLLIGRSLKDSMDFRTAYYFTSSSIPKCVASWPVVWYKNKIVTADEDDYDGRSVWKHAYHISAHTLNAIRGEDEVISLLVRIRDVEAVPISS